MKTQNGIHVFDEADELPALPGPVASPKQQSKFGYHLVESKNGWRWEPATEDDYRKSEGIRLGVPPENIDVPKIECWALDPQRCSVGNCYGTQFCRRIWNSQGNYWYCACA